MSDIDKIPGAYPRIPVMGPRDPLTYHNRDRFYSTARWQRLRTLVISQVPFCQLCRKMVQTIDHLDGNTKNNVRDNLVALCNSCHGWKSNEFEKKVRLSHIDPSGKLFIELARQLPTINPEPLPATFIDMVDDYDTAACMLPYIVNRVHMPREVALAMFPIGCGVHQVERWLCNLSLAGVERVIDQARYRMVSVWQYAILKQRYANLMGDV